VPENQALAGVYLAKFGQSGCPKVRRFGAHLRMGQRISWRHNTA